MSAAAGQVKKAVAVETGLRAGELRNVTKESFDLKASLGTVTVEAAYSKRRRRDVLTSDSRSGTLVAATGTSQVLSP